MPPSKQHPLAWETRPFLALVHLAWPIVVSMLSVSTMTLVDTLFVSQLGSGAIAGVGLAGILTFSLWCFPMGVVRAVKILVSQASGAGQRQQFHSYLKAALIVSVVLGLVVAIIGVLAAPLLPRLTATVESGKHAAEYLSVRALGSVPFLLLVSIQETRQGFGDSRSMMFATLFGNALNVCLDYILIFVFHWGVAGAAWASTIAVTLEMAALASLHLWRDGFEMSGFRALHLRRLVSLGLPSGVQFALEVSSFGVMVVILSSFSELHTAAHQIAIQTLHFAFLPAFAFAEAGSVLAGQAVGAGRLQLVGLISKLTLRMAWAYALLCGSVLFLAAERIVSAFTQQVELRTLTINLFMIIAVFQFFDAANLVARGVLRGAGDVRFVAVVGIVVAWVCTPPLTYLLGYLLGWGAYGAWIGLSGEVAIATVVLWRRLKAGAWHPQTLDNVADTLEPISRPA